MAGDTVTLKLTPDEGYLLARYYIGDRVGNPAEILSDYSWVGGTNTLSFKMIDENAYADCVFDKSVDNPDLYKMNMPVGETRQLTIPSGLLSFKVHFDGGQSNDSSNGVLEITCPEGRYFSMSSNGTIGADDALTIYDGLATDANVIVNGKSAISRINSTGNKLLINYQPGSDEASSGFDITFQVLEPISGDGTADNPYIINDSYSWLQFVDLVNNGSANTCARLTTYLNLSVENAADLVGTKEHPYTGTFDGQGNDIAFRDDVSGDSLTDDIALFRWISGATIENLNVHGRIVGPQKNAASIVAHVANSSKTSILRKCFSTVILMPEPDGVWGGLVGKAEGPLSIEDCESCNPVSLRANGKAEQVAAMVAVADAKTSIKNCYILKQGEAVYPISLNLDNITTSNCYCDEGFKAQDNVSIVDSDDKASGKLLVQLQNGRTDATYWYQVWSPWNFSNTQPSVYNRSSNEGPNLGDDCIYYDTNEQGFYCNSFEIGHEGKFPRIDFKTDSVSNWSLSEGLNTLCLPYSIDFATLGCKTYQLDNVDGNTLVFREASGPTQPAQPYIVSCPSKGISLSAKDVTFRGSLDPQSKSQSGVEMCGTYDQLNNDTLASLNAYILQEDSLWHPVVKGNNAYILPTRAFITSEPVMAKSFSMVLNDNGTTGISNIKTIDTDGTLKYYDLNGNYIGTSLNGARKGIYVTNKGKKVMR